jgi:Protein of unknown function (DUF1236)
MHKANFGILAAAALIGLSGVSLAQTQTWTTTTTTTTEITPDQERTIYTTVTREQMAAQPQPPDWAPQIGAEVPAQIQLYDMPASIDVPTIRSDRYTVVNGHVVIVDPTSRQVVHVIESN